MIEDVETTPTVHYEKIFRRAALHLCGYRDGAETTADGSADNDLAQDRADVVMTVLSMVKTASLPEEFIPLGTLPTDSEIRRVLSAALRAYSIDRGTKGSHLRMVDRVDTVMAFADLVREHPDPRLLLPRGDRLGEWLPPGTPVTVLGHHAGVVAPGPDTVRVQLTGQTIPVEFPRSAVVKEGETWTPPKLTQ
jgi:hypothetical protein